MTQTKTHTARLTLWLQLRALCGFNENIVGRDHHRFLRVKFKTYLRSLKKIIGNERKSYVKKKCQDYLECNKYMGG